MFGIWDLGYGIWGRDDMNVEEYKDLIDEIPQEKNIYDNKDI